MRRPDRDWLVDAAQHLEKLRAHLELEGITEDVVLDASAMRMSAAIDSVGKISEALQRSEFADLR